MNDVPSIRTGSRARLWQALNVSVIELLDSEDNGTQRKKRGIGPTGKMRRFFEAASQLPRSQQEKLTAVLEAFVNHPRGECG